LRIFTDRSDCKVRRFQSSADYDGYIFPAVRFFDFFVQKKEDFNFF